LSDTAKHPSNGIKKDEQKQVFHSSSSEDTFNLASRIGKQLRGGEVILLIGELGSGKTLFAKGLARGLGVEDSQEVTSPSFTLVHQHLGRFKFYHVDLFRISSLDEIYQLGLEEIMIAKNVVAIEWAEKLGPLTPKNAIKVLFRNLGEGKRSITLLRE